MGEYSSAAAGFCTSAYLAFKYKTRQDADTYINGSVCPDENIFAAITALRSGEVLSRGNITLAYKLIRRSAQLSRRCEATPVPYNGTLPVLYFLKIF